MVNSSKVRRDERSDKRAPYPKRVTRDGCKAAGKDEVVVVVVVVAVVMAAVVVVDPIQTISE